MKKRYLNSFLASQVREIAVELLKDALENGDVLALAQDLRGDIADGWNAALDEIGMEQNAPDHFAKLRMED